MDLSWITDNWLPIGLVTFMALEKIVKLSPAKWDDLIIDGLKAALRKNRTGKIKVPAVIIAFLAASMLVGCAKTYTPPQGCECEVKEDGHLDMRQLYSDMEAAAQRAKAKVDARFWPEG